MLKYSSSLLFCLLLGILVFSGCKNCTHCKYDYTDPETGESLTFNYAEFCGTRDEVKNFKDQVNADAAEVNGIVECSSDK